MSERPSILDILLAVARKPAREIDSVAGWWRLHTSICGHPCCLDEALISAARVDRLAWAFASGYACALDSLVPGLERRRAALCATEANGVHPRAIETTLKRDGKRWRVNGVKTMVTLGAHADELLVLASKGQGADGRNQLRLVRVPASAKGVSVEALPATPFVPELPHARVVLKDVAVKKKRRLKGDAYVRYLKPFRTVEDIFVHGALLAWLLGIARRSGWPAEVIEELLVRISASRSLSIASPSSPGVHAALGGLICSTGQLLERIERHWERVDPAVRERWERDRPLLSVAGKARSRRLEVAWERLNS